MEDRCLQFPMDTEKPLCFPTILPRGKLPAKVIQDKSPNLVLVTPWWPSQPWFPLLKSLAITQPRFLRETKRTLVLPHSEDLHFLWRQLKLAIWIVSGDDKKELTLSKDVRDVLAQSIRPETSSQYFVNWCISRETDPAEAPLAEVLEFLSHLFRGRSLAYRTINCYRSAISSFRAPINGSNVGKHLLVSRFLKGVFNFRPPLLKYTFFWDVKTVLDHLSSWNSPKMLDLKQLSVKSVTLLAINCHGRSSDLT